MEVYAKRDSAISWRTRPLFIMGLVGFIVAASGFTRLAIGHAKFEYELAQKNAQLAQRAAKYDGNWHNKQDSGLVTAITISNNGLNLYF